MKVFLYCLTSIRNGSEDGVAVMSGSHYYHDHLLAVIEAENAEHAARALNTKILSSFERSSVNCPTIYYTSDYYEGRERPLNHREEGYFFLSLKEPEEGDMNKHPNFEEKIRLKVTAPRASA